MIAAVTGGTGFIGRALVQRLLSSHRFSEVRVLTRGRPVLAGVRVYCADLVRDPLEGFVRGADVVFHCAGEVREKSVMRKLHVQGTERLVSAARGQIRLWVQLSSVGAYGGALRKGIVDENCPVAPDSDYEVTKVESDFLVTEASASGAFVSVTLRPSIVFGPGMPNRSLYQLVTAVDRGLFFFVNREAIANYVYVDDVAEALAACSSAPVDTLYNLSDDRTMEEFIGAIAVQLGRATPRLTVSEGVARLAARVGSAIPRFPLTISRIEALSRQVRYPSRRIRCELNYEFRVSIEEGLRRFVADWRADR
jgi:nucleoside-diphosphate-sugar epimerase